MNKGKIVTSIGAVLLTTGIIGGIWSGVVAMPKIINNVQNVENNLNKEDILYKGRIDLTKLNINSKTSNVIIKKYDGQNVIVGRNGNKKVSTITTKESGSELTINEDINNRNLGKSIDDMVRYFVDELYTSYTSNITVYVPDNVDINVNTNNGGLNVSDVNVNNLNFNTSNGSIALHENCNINNLTIKSNGFINLKVREVYCTDNLSIECTYVNIYEDTFVNNESKVPESVKILINKKYSSNDNDSVVINTNLPIAKNLDITSNETVDLNLPILDYKFNEKSYMYKTFVNFLLKNKKIFENIKKYDKIIPVPISKKRYKERGYNQSLLIAKEISMQISYETNNNIKLELVNNCLIKTKNIIEQSKLNKEDRQHNIQGVYTLKNGSILTNKSILLLDDIYTTGSTVNECSRVLQQAKPNKIGVLVLAKD